MILVWDQSNKERLCAFASVRWKSFIIFAEFYEFLSKRKFSTRTLDQETQLLLDAKWLKNLAIPEYVEK